MENQRILVIGGNGYIGRGLVKKLKLNNFDVTVLLRKNIPGYESKNIVGDLLDKACLLKKVRNFDLVVNLASIIRTVHKGRYQENILGLRNVIDAMGANSIKRIIYLSTQNVNLAGKGYYAASKVLCEKILKKTNLDYVIIRPSIVYGIDKQNDFYRLVSLIDKWRVAPIIGSGENKMQPVLKDDLVNVIILAAKNFNKNQIIEVNGKDTVSMNQIIDYISRSLKVAPIKIHAPLAILKIFKKFIPFDIDGYTEDRISRNCAENKAFSSFFDNLDAMISLCKEKQG